ncbi:MAG TPA: hypothetical protein VHG53_06990 [Candidatus Limnocylindria bacterium]|nr:hypothetical protein [Candidatus Limnocylindria bacterium]
MRRLQYAAGHVKIPLAPLQPPVADRPHQPEEPEDEAPAPTLSASPRPPSTAQHSATPATSNRPPVAIALATPAAAPRTAAPTIARRLTLAPGVRATKLPAISNTHSS